MTSRITGSLRDSSGQISCLRRLILLIFLLVKRKVETVSSVCRISEKESNFVKEKTGSADKVNKEDDPFLDW